MTSEKNAEVHLMRTAIDRKTVTINIHVHLPDSLVEHVTVGMFVEAGIITSKTEQSAFPEETLIIRQGFSYVLQQEREVGGIIFFLQKRLSRLSEISGPGRIRSAGRNYKTCKGLTPFYSSDFAQYFPLSGSSLEKSFYVFVKISIFCK